MGPTLDVLAGGGLAAAAVTHSAPGASGTGTVQASYMTSEVVSSPNAAISRELVKMSVNGPLNPRNALAPVTGASGRFAHDAIGDVGHGLLEIVTGPCVVVSKRDLQRRRDDLGHMGSPPDRVTLFGGVDTTATAIGTRPDHPVAPGSHGRSALPRSGWDHQRMSGSVMAKARAATHSRVARALLPDVGLAHRCRRRHQGVLH